VGGEIERRPGASTLTSTSSVPAAPAGPGKQTLVGAQPAAPAPARPSPIAAPPASPPTEREAAERTAVHDKLLGLDEIYKVYREYRTLSMLPESDVLRDQLAQQLPRFGFATIEEFAAYVERFERSFAAGALRIALDLLGRYAATLAQEAQRYRDPLVVKGLYQRLSGFRANQQLFRKNAPIWNDYAARANHEEKQRGLPGSGGMAVEGPTIVQMIAGANARAAKASAEGSIQLLAKDYPIFTEDGLPPAHRIDKNQLAQVDEDQLMPLLLGHVATRSQAIADARAQLEADHALIYRLDRLMPRFYAELEIQPGSIHDQIVQDRIHADAMTKAVTGIVLALVAIALTVVSLGAATPAGVAAAASVGAASVNAYMAYDESRQYTAQHALGHAGLTDDPSVAWLALAIVGAGLDAAAAAKAVRALAPAARALDAGGELARFTSTVDALARSRQLDDQIATAANRAAAARRGFTAAKGELTAALSKAYAFPGPFTDPDVYRALVKMAAAKLREGSHSLSVFLAELKQARLAAHLAELSPEELVKAKQAWADAQRLVSSATKPAEITSEGGRVIGRYQHGSQLEILSKDADLHGGNTIRLDPEATTTITGTLDKTNTVARRGERMPGITVMGENAGGINLLRSRKWTEIQLKYKSILESGDKTTYWRKVTDEFWDTVNRPWLDEAIARNDKFRFVSNPAKETDVFVTMGKDEQLVLDRGEQIRSIFGREVDYLQAKGYTFGADGIAARTR
jgi:hypothetical protein